MNQPLMPSARRFTLATTALAVSLMLAACGGGDVTPPPDTTAPTVAITDDVSAASTAGAVLFTFTFSEDVGSSFTAEDVLVTGGTAGAFTKVSATVYTLSVTPSANTAGSISVSVAAGKFSDVALNANTAAAAATQAYDTTVTTPPASGGTVLLNFDDKLPTSAMGGEGGDASGVDAAPPAGGGTTGSAYKVLRSGGQTYALAILETALPLTTTRKTISARVYSPTAGIPMVIKLEGATSAVNTGDVQANEAVVVGWQTLTWTFNSAGTATYTKMVLLPNLGTVDAAPGKSYYFDDFKLLDAAAVTPPPTTGTVLLNFDDKLPTAAFGGEGGDASGVDAAPPAGGGTASAYKVLRSGGQPYALAILETSLPLTSTRKTISARVYSPTAGIPMVIKLEGSTTAVNTGDVPANEAVVAGWQTLTWTFNSAGTATYTKMVLLPNLGTVDAAPGKSYYFDDFKLLDAAAVTPPPTTGTVLLNFDDLLPTAAFGGEGGDASGVDAAPPAGGGTASAYKVLRSGGQPYALAILETPLPLTSTRKTISARVYSPTAGIPMVIKLEGTTSAVNSGEVPANEAVVVGWQTLTWTFNTAGTATYVKMVLLPNLGTVDAAPGKSYYFDDFKLLDAASGSGGTGSVSGLPITFDGAGVTYTFTGFEGGEDSSLAADPAGGSNMVGKVVRAAAGPWYGGTTVSTGANKSIATLPFTASAKTMSMRVYSPGAGMRVRMKVENAGDPTITCETDAVTVGTGWERLTFNFANPGLSPPVTGGPTAALNVAATYNKVSVFFNVAAAGDNWAGTYYFDDIAFGTP